VIHEIGPTHGASTHAVLSCQAARRRGGAAVRGARCAVRRASHDGVVTAGRAKAVIVEAK
jgi:hypothetical protein